MHEVLCKSNRLKKIACQKNRYNLLENYKDLFLAYRFCISKKNESKELIALVCFGETQNSEWKYILFGSLSVTSSCFLFITLVVYIILPELREVQDKAMMSAVASLTASYTILAIQHLRKVELPTSEGNIEDDVMCIPLGE